MLFIDSADPKEIQRWFQTGVVSGVTTNPILIQRENAIEVLPLKKRIEAILEVSEGPVSVQLMTETEDQMLLEALRYHNWSPRIVIKVPFSELGLIVTRCLSNRNIPVNMTALTSYGQAMLTLEAGASYASLLMCRMMDQNLDSLSVIAASKKRSERVTRERIARAGTNGLPADGAQVSRILVGSIRNKANVEEATDAGADIVTVPPRILVEMLEEPGTEKVLEEFRAAARA